MATNPTTIALTVEAGDLAIARLASTDPVPKWATGSFVSVTRTADELSIVCDAANVPAGVTVQTPFRALKVAGPLDFALTGVMAAITRPLADAGVTVFVVSTYDTDYVLVRADRLDAAADALRGAGLVVT